MDPSNVVVSLAEALLKPRPIAHVLFVMLWHVVSIRYCPAEQEMTQQTPFMRALLLKIHGGVLVPSVVMLLQPSVVHDLNFTCCGVEPAPGNSIVLCISAVNLFSLVANVNVVRSYIMELPKLLATTKNVLSSNLKCFQSVAPCVGIECAGWNGA